MGYPFSGEVEKDAGRIVGIPFFAAYYDSEGRDYIGSFRMISMTMNGFFWFLVPNIFLLVYVRKRKKRLATDFTSRPQGSRHG